MKVKLLRDCTFGKKGNILEVASGSEIDAGLKTLVKYSFVSKIKESKKLNAKTKKENRKK